MTWEWLAVASLSAGTIACMVISARYLIQAAAYQRISRKILTREPLTDYERKLLGRLPDGPA